MGLIGSRERKILEALAGAAIPAGRFIPAGGPPTVERLERYFENLPAWSWQGLRALLWTLELYPVARTGSTFSALPAEGQARVLDALQAARSATTRQLLRVLLTAIKASHFDDPALFARVHCRYGVDAPPEEKPRWRAQITDGDELRERTELEADVVIVGTGAGGASLAYELARRGHAVLLLEEGRYHSRAAFTGRASEMTRRLYRDMGLTIALGNIATPVWAGRAVGGSTVINSGTCYRAPEEVFHAWRAELGLTMFSSETMDGYYARVESILGVAEAEARYLGGVARVVARGAGLLGLSHRPLRRNAPGCDGQGVCCFGCPTGAKRSTDVSYVPMALERGAALVTSARVERVVVEGGVARGLRARTGGGAELVVTARATVLAGGALMTPLILQASGVGNGSGMVGRNLSIHPASKVMALFDERIDMANAIPQGYCVEEWAHEGLMFEGASTPFDVTAVAIPFAGPRFTDVMERFPNLASFGFMIRDTSRGSVRRGAGGRPLILYSLNAHDTARMQRGVERLCEIFLRAGAVRVFPCVAGFDEIRSEGELERLRRARLRAGDLELAAFHPLGTCRMGTDPRRSVVGPDHECHDVRGLYVCDGSAVPTPLGVNPQVTIMALSTRAAEILDARLDARAVSPSHASQADAASALAAAGA